MDWKSAKFEELEAVIDWESSFVKKERFKNVLLKNIHNKNGKYILYITKPFELNMIQAMDHSGMLVRGNETNLLCVPPEVGSANKTWEADEIEPCSIATFWEKLIEIIGSEPHIELPVTGYIEDISGNLIDKGALPVLYSDVTLNDVYLKSLIINTNIDVAGCIGTLQWTIYPLDKNINPIELKQEIVKYKNKFKSQKGFDLPVKYIVDIFEYYKARIESQFKIKKTRREANQIPGYDIKIDFPEVENTKRDTVFYEYTINVNSVITFGEIEVYENVHDFSDLDLEQLLENLKEKFEQERNEEINEDVLDEIRERITDDILVVCS